MARTSLVVTFTGPDCPGIVASFARVVGEHGGNWEESRMARLAGQFAGILEVTIEADRAQALTEELARVSGLRVTVDDAGRLPLPEGRGWSSSSPGRIARASSARWPPRWSPRACRSRSCTPRARAPMSGELLFHAHAELRCPEGFDQAALRKALEAVSSELLVDIRLSDTHG